VSIIAYLALFGWTPFIVALFALLPGRRAAIVAVIGAWLLLPPYRIPIANFPDYSKNTAATIGMVLGVLIFGPDRILTFRPRWFDLPMLGWCLCGIVSSLYNGLGLYDGLSNALNETIHWGLPYLFGRIYFSDFRGLRDFSVGMVIGGLAYVPPCLYEIRMSPQLLGHVYGFTTWQGIRLGGYRPRVFFWTGLECGMWMTAATLVAWWLWRCGTLKTIGRTPFGIPLVILTGTTLMCRSTGALILLAVGMGTLWASTRFQTRKVLLALLLVAPVYVALRVPNLWSGEHAVKLIRTLIDAERAHSLEYRFLEENLLIAKAVQQPVFGWGGWGRSAVYWEGEGYRWQVPVDGRWLATFGVKGFVGLILLYVAMALPAFLFLRNVPVRLWNHPHVAAATVAAALLGLNLIDLLVNGFINMIYVTLAGGLISLRMIPHTTGRLGVHGARFAGGTGGSGRVCAASGPGTRDRLDTTARSLRDTRHSRAGTVRLANQYRSLGRMLKREGRLAEAEAAWRQALELVSGLTAADPDATELQRQWCDCANDLAWFRLHHMDRPRGDAASALVLASRAVEICPNSSVYWNTLGVAHLRASEFASAVSALNQAVALGNGGTAFDDVFLSMAHARLGHLDQARQWLAQGLRRMEQDHPGHPDLRRFCDEARALIVVGAEATAATLGAD
jgi:tetratricopeptide (TPR) repeat protein